MIERDLNKGLIWSPKKNLNVPNKGTRRSYSENWNNDKHITSLEDKVQYFDRHEYNGKFDGYISHILSEEDKEAIKKCNHLAEKMKWNGNWLFSIYKENKYKFENMYKNKS
jgi:hypothetical protein